MCSRGCGTISASRTRKETPDHDSRLLDRWVPLGGGRDCRPRLALSESAGPDPLPLEYRGQGGWIRRQVDVVRVPGGDGGDARAVLLPAGPIPPALRGRYVSIHVSLHNGHRPRVEIRGSKRKI